MTSHLPLRSMNATLPLALLLFCFAGVASSSRAAQSQEFKEIAPREVEELIAKVKPEDPFPPIETLKDVRGTAMLVAALKKEPRDPWLNFVSLSFAANQQTARSLKPDERLQTFADLLVLLKEARRIINEDMEPKNELTQLGMQALEQNINEASLEAGVDFEKVIRSAEAMLNDNTDETAWDFGNVIFKAHTMLGRVALRQGRLEDAKRHLLESGKTPGSPQLDSFGPDFILAGELVQAGERPVVIEFLDLVAKFWATPRDREGELPSYRGQKRLNREQLERWKQQVSNGEIPRSRPDRSQGWPAESFDADK